MVRFCQDRERKNKEFISLLLVQTVKYRLTISRELWSDSGTRQLHVHTHIHTKSQTNTNFFFVFYVDKVNNPLTTSSKSQKTKPNCLTLSRLSQNHKYISSDLINCSFNCFYPSFTTFLDNS